MVVEKCRHAWPTLRQAQSRNSQRVPEALYVNLPPGLVCYMQHLPPGNRKHSWEASCCTLSAGSNKQIRSAKYKKTRGHGTEGGACIEPKGAIAGKQTGPQQPVENIKPRRTSETKAGKLASLPALGLPLAQCHAHVRAAPDGPRGIQSKSAATRGMDT